MHYQPAKFSGLACTLQRAYSGSLVAHFQSNSHEVPCAGRAQALHFTRYNHTPHIRRIELAVPPSGCCGSHSLLLIIMCFAPGFLSLNQVRR